MKGKLFKKALAVATSVLMLSGGVPIQPLSQVFEDIAITASAESTITPVTPQLDSDGFYSIGTAAELYGFAELVNNGNATANAKLTANIVVNENVLDANGEANTGDFVQWTPIGNDYFEDKVYSGTFDGQGHTISGLYVSGSGWYVGLIGTAGGSAVVKNLGVVDSYFGSSNNYIGSIVGGLSDGSSVTLANVYSTSTVKGENYIGSIVGGLSDGSSVTLANVYSTSTVKGENYIGGLVDSDGTSSVTIINSYFAGKTSANWAYGSHHDDLVSGDFDRSTLTVCNAFVLGTSQYGTSVTAEQMSDGTVAAALHYYQDALADGSMFGLSGGKTNFSGTIDGVSVPTANITLHTFTGDTKTYSSKYIVGNTTPLPVNVEREGYTFFGWYDNADLEGDAVTSISSSETGDKEYWAKFERSHAVSFVLGGGTIRSGEIDHYIEGETTALPTMVFKNGASFEGWYTTSDCSGERYVAIPATATEDMTFYAKWGAEKTTFYLMQVGELAPEPEPEPEPASLLYEGESIVWLDKTTLQSYKIFNNEHKYWGSGGYINVPYDGGEYAFSNSGNNFIVHQSGFYVFTLTDMGDGNWFISVLRSLENCTISDIPDQTYTGSEIAPEITVTDGEKTLTLGTDYEVTYSDNTNVGTAKATITGKGNYGGTIVKTFAINKATPTVTAPTANTLTYNGNEQELVTAGSTDFGTVLYSLDGETYSETIPKATDTGTYTVYYKVDTDNYYYAPQTVEVTIAESYTITWKNGDEILETDNYVPGGATPEYNGETPTKAGEDNEVFVFNGWDSEPAAVTGDMTYTAQFIKYTKVSATLATYTSAGNSEYYTCEDGKYYILSNGEFVEVAEGSWILPELEKTEVIIKSIDINGTATPTTVYAETFTAADYTVPSAPYMDGYNFSGWKVNDTLYTTADGVKTAVTALVAEKPETAITVVVVYEKKTDTFNVTVTGGKLSDGTTSGTYQVSTLMTAKADAAETGKKFSHWMRNGKKVSSNETYSFYMPSGEVTLEAVYADDTAEIEKSGTAIIESVTPNAATGKVSFVSVVNVPTGCTMVKGGLVATSNSSICENVTADNASFVKLSTKITANTKNLKYTWTKSNVKEMWYVRSYLVYKDSNNTLHTVYSDVVKANLTGIIS